MVSAIPLGNLALRKTVIPELFKAFASNSVPSIENLDRG
jgi:hypothetical protein